MSYSSIPSGNIGGADPLIGSPENPMTRPQVLPLQAITKPSPVEFIEPHYYICTVANASFHRQDGTRIGFRFGFLETNVKATVEYLDWEITSGNQYLRKATENEVLEAKMRNDPIGTIKEKVREEIEAELRVKLEAEIREKLGMLGEINKSPAEKEHSRSAADANKLAGSDIKDRIAATTNVQREGNAKVIIDPPNSGVNRLQGVVSSADIAGAAKGS